MLLSALNMDNYAFTLERNQVDGPCLCECECVDDIQQLGVSLMPKARLLFRFIEEYKRDGVSASLIPAESRGDGPSDDGDRRGGEREETRSSAINGRDTLRELDRSEHGVSQGIRGGGGGGRGALGDFDGDSNAGDEVLSSPSPTSATLSARSNQNSLPIPVSLSLSLPPQPVVVSRLQPVRISGCIGDRSNDINGIYDPVDEMCDGFCRYLKRGGQNNWIEYNATRGHWHVKKAESKGSVNAWAYCVSSSVPPDTIAASFAWHVYNGSDFPEQVSPS